MSEKQLSRPMWTCPQCGRPFANAHQSHACSRHTLAEHLEGKPAAIIALYRHLEAVIQSMGPVIVVPEKTRIAFRLSALEEIDAELTAWIAEAYLVGEQRHLRSSLEDPPS